MDGSVVFASRCHQHAPLFAWAHTSPHPKRHFDRFSHFCTDHDRVSPYIAMGCHFSPSKFPIHAGTCTLIEYMVPWTHLSTKRHLVRFSHFHKAHGNESTYLTMGRPFPLKIAPTHWGIFTPSKTQFRGSTGVHNPHSISISSAVSAGLTTVTDRQTDRPRYSVYNNTPHLHSTAMQPKKLSYNICA